MRGDKRGVSPVIATVMLIAIVIVMGLIVFTWIQGIQEEAITKFDNQNVKVVCEEVQFDASYSGGFLAIANAGNVPIFKMQAKISGAGEHETVILGEEDDSWPPQGLTIGGTYAGSIASVGTKMILIPVLVGMAGEIEKSHVCDERHGKEIVM